MVANKTLKNIYVDIQGSGIRAKPGDTSLNRIITVSNRGNQLASIELWLEPTDERSTALRQWTELDVPITGLRLEVGETKDVHLKFRIPPQAKHGFYSYSICASSDQYPGEEVRRSQQLQVLPSSQELELRNKPNVVVEPETDSDNPYELNAGSTCNVRITITNPSRRTDLFLLSCVDLPSSWYDIEYPEKQNISPGVVRKTEGLELNPKESGEIVLSIHPPQYAAAGNYFPTVQIHSNNRKELTIFEIIYLKILVSSDLELQLKPSIKKIKNPSRKEYFELAIFNFGNIKRHIKVCPQDIDQLFQYKLIPNKVVELLPGEDKTVQIVPLPSWRRRYLFRLRELKTQFEITLQNIWDSPSPLSIEVEPTLGDSSIQNAPQVQWRSPNLPEKPVNGTIILEARGGWLWKLLLTIFFTVATAGVIFLIWKHFFWKPSLEPRVSNFESAQAEYKEAVDENIKFNFEITNFDQIDKILVYQGQQDPTLINKFAANPQTLRGDPLEDFVFIYQLNGLGAEAITNENPPTTGARDPKELAFLRQEWVDSCAPVEVGDSNRLLKPLFDSYRYIIHRLSKNKKKTTHVEKILRCIDVPFKVAPITDEFEDTNGVNNRSGEEETIDVSLPKGDYAFTLMVYKNEVNSQTITQDRTVQNVSSVTSPVDTAFIKKIKVAPPPPPAPPKILEFSASSPEYQLPGENPVPASTRAQVVTSDETPEINTDAGDNFDDNEVTLGTSVQNNFPRFDNRVSGNLSGDETSLVPILLNWEISSATDIEEIKLVSVSPEGVENVQPITYDNFRWEGDRLDIGLEPYCRRSKLNQLICRDVEIPVEQAGEYTFTLTILTNRDDVEEEITAQTSTILVKEPSPKIVSFQVNGEKVLEKPKFVYPVNLERVSFEIELTWDVQDETTVELLPAPGVVDSEGLIYIISAAPGAETLTLRATNKAGEQVERSVVIEKVEFTPLPNDKNGSDSSLPLLPPPPPPTLSPSSGQFPVYQFDPETD